MTANNTPQKNAAVPAVVVTRTVQAPCDLVWRAWTEPDQLAQWFSPEAAECRGVTADVRVGGAFRIRIKCADKDENAGYGTYLEVVPHRRLRLTWQWENYAMPDSVITVEFEDLGKATRVTLTHAGLPDQEDAADHNRGWSSLADKFVRVMEQHQLKPAANK